MKTVAWLFALLLSLSVGIQIAEAFCGFYVAKADTKIFNKASQVVLARQDDKTVITMVNDFKGDPKEFAVVIPVPTLIEKGQINVGDKKVIDHLDAYTSPRLVEYHDGNPCQLALMERRMARDAALPASQSSLKRAEALGVTVQAQYTVGEYDIVILSAKQGEGLETWLKENGYRLPKGASEVLGSYIKQKMHFFVAKVNLQEQSKLGFSYLRPIQVAFESPKFMLPLRLGTLNADGYQELFIYTLTQKGRVEPTNYRSIKLPTDMDVPLFIKTRFKDFYRDMFDHQVKKVDMRAVFTEYAWDMNWCDPCAADPLSAEELRSLGVFWMSDAGFVPGQGRRSIPPMGGAPDVFVTRMHVRYDAQRFPEDLILQETADRNNFQGRYVLRHPWKGTDSSCPAADDYRREVLRRQENEARQLAELTGWKLADIRAQMNLGADSGSEKWWQKLWQR
ncbi:MAG TPA: DUF2330 domain-containing protein [Candidatus Binatia bacterium]|nr:DUF2330 domain-containing protein [Candidatus Binatia bacterium]